MNIDALQNPGIAMLNPETAPGQTTVIVTGLARSGTSMAAKALTMLGIWMGNTYDQAVFEDQEMADAITNGRDAVLKLVSRNNEAHDVWGFKRPMILPFLSENLAAFRNPRLVIPFRDPLSIAMRNHLSMRADLTRSLNDAARQNADLVAFVSMLSVPIMLFSYEKAISNRFGFLEALARFAGAPSEDLDRALVERELSNAPDIYIRSSNILNDGA